jgi:UDP-N-acetylmuramyl pentapeptide phosphotransferase/UDP-N-acetylglucosamine-1-phosphate transferase
MQELVKLNYIVAYSLISFLIAFVLYPWYIRLLKYLKAGKTLRDDSTS